LPSAQSAKAQKIGHEIEGQSEEKSQSLERTLIRVKLESGQESVRAMLGTEKTKAEKRAK